MSPSTRRGQPRPAALYLGVVVALHLVWETLQLPLYTIWRTDEPRAIAFAVLHCTAGDAMIASASLLVAWLALGRPAWPSERFIAVMVTTVVVGVGYTVASEWWNTEVRKSGAYSTLMPTVPLLGTGLSPLMQWLVVPAMGFAFVGRRHGRPK